MSDAKPLSDEELRQLPTNAWDFSPRDVWRLIARIRADAERIAALTAERDRLAKSEEYAWGIIANAGGGNWDLETDMWRKAAERWRDEYHAHIMPVAPEGR